MTSGDDEGSNGIDDECCGSCNSQLCTSYLLGLLACTLVVGGVFLAFHRWDYMWLAVSAVGIVLILVGAALHYCGSHNTSRSKRGTRRDLGHNEHLLPSAPTLSNSYSVSQLSLNMLPPYFPAYDTMSIATQADGSIAASQIMQINGQSFLLLPLTESMAETQSLANRLSVQLVQAPHEQPSNKLPSTANILQQNNFPTQSANQPYSFPLQVNLQQMSKNDSDTSEVLSVSEGDIQTETPTYLSLEPTYESLDHIGDESTDDYLLASGGEFPSISTVPLPVCDNEQTNESVSDTQPSEESSVLNEVSDSLENESQVLVSISITADNEDDGNDGHDREERTIELESAILPISGELNIPNPSPRSITPEPDQMSFPPPSYDEVANVSIGVYGVAYGTI